MASICGLRLLQQRHLSSLLRGELVGPVVRNWGLFPVNVTLATTSFGRQALGQKLHSCFERNAGSECCCSISRCRGRLPKYLICTVMTRIASEIQRFNRLSATWWNPVGPMRPLQVVNALRLHYVSERIARNLGRSISNMSLNGVRILDVGCGGGLLSEPLTRSLSGT